MERAEERSSKLEDRAVGTPHTAKQWAKRIKQSQNVQELWGNFNRCNIRIILMPEGNIKENGGEGFKRWSGRNGLCLRKYVKIHFVGTEEAEEP